MSGYSLDSRTIHLLKSVPMICYLVLFCILGGASTRAPVALASSKASVGPTFVLEPPSKVDFTNSTGVVIPCTAKGNPEPTILWERKDGTSAPSIPGLRQIQHDGSLALFPFSAERYRQDIHGIVYRCTARNSVGKIRSRDVHIKAVVLQNYEVHVADHFVIRGNTAVLQCHYPSSVKSYVKVILWIREDGVSIGSPGVSGEKYTVLPTGELLISNANPTDSFLGYQCQIHNTLSGESKLSTSIGKVIVREPHSPVPPTITELKHVIRCQEGEKVYFPCLGQAHPLPSYRWLRKDGERLYPVQLRHRTHIGEGMFIIEQALIQDSGVYVCIVNNSVGEERTEVKLLVMVNLKVKLEPTVQTVDIGKKATLSCTVTGHPVHSVSWVKDGSHLSTNEHVTLIGRDLIQFSPAQREDAGMYQCFVSNDGQVVQATAQLNIGEDAPVFLSTFPEQAVRPGSPVSLKCSASGNPLPQITWTLDGLPVPEAYHIRIGDYVSDERTVNSYINITAVNIEDGGVYACIAENGVQRIQHASRINVFGPPYIRPLKNATALDGHTVYLHCPASGYPVTKISWERDGRPLPHNHRQKTFANGTLIIENLQRSKDDGWYTCVAENNKGRSARRNVALTIMTPPVIEPFSFPSELTEGKRASVACVVSAGDLPIQIRWMKDGRPLPDELRGAISIANDFTSLLSIPSVKQFHSGNYTCIATNPVASRDISASMVVRVPPKWRTEPSDKSIIMGKTVTFDCQADGFPDPVVRWKKSSGGSKTNFQVIISSENTQILENGSLVIKEASQEDSGYYMCQATNDVGPGMSTVVKLTVHVAAHFTQKFQAFTTKRGVSVTLSCKALGEKPMTIVWSKEKHPFNPAFEPRYVFEESIHPDGVQSTIRIPSTNRKDSSLFSCSAENLYGKDETNFQVIIQEIPDRPHGLEITNKGSRTVSLQWSHPYSGNSPIVKYIIQYKTASDTWASAKVTTAEPANNVYTVQGLIPQSSYHIRLRAENAVGNSEFSDVLAVTTDGEAPSGPPKNVRVLATSSKTLQVTWKPPSKEEQHGAVEGYYVGYKVKGSKEPFAYKTLETSQGTPQETELTNLQKFTKYSVIVQAFNNKGAGPPSEEVVVITLEFDPPTAPSLRLVSSTPSSIHLAWEYKDKEKDPNPISGFILFQKSDTQEWEEVQLPDDRNSYTFRGLQCGMRYQFYLIAFNTAGRGPPSDVMSARTEGTPPIAPERKSLLAINTTFITLHLYSWQGGVCPITFFVVQYKPRDQREWILLSNNILPDQKTVTIPDLFPATWYSLLMTAHNDAGATEAEYVFATLTLSGATVPPLSSTSQNDKEFLHQLKIIIPVACTAVVLVLILTVACVILIRRRNSHSHGQTIPQEDPRDQETAKTVDTVPMSVWEKGGGAGGRIDPRLSHSREQLYFPAPYASSRISMYSADGDPEAGALQHWRTEEREHTYDVPFLPRQVTRL